MNEHLRQAIRDFRLLESDLYKHILPYQKLKARVYELKQSFTVTLSDGSPMRVDYHFTEDEIKLLGLYDGMIELTIKALSPAIIKARERIEHFKEDEWHQ